MELIVRAWVADVEQVMLDLLHRQDKSNRKLAPELQFLVALYDNKDSGRLPIAATVDQYATHPEQFAGYYDDKLLMLNQITAYESVKEYYRRKGESFGTSEHQIDKVLKEMDL